MVVGDTEKFAPLALDPIAVPPEEVSNHSIVFPDDVAFRLEDAPLHIAVGVAVTEVGAAGEIHAEI
ncbi:hypothetical protein GCM10023115_27050 [Pontixanthobacter gangjinensis]